MPNFIAQLLKLLLDLPPGMGFVSIYESNSADATTQWLHLLRLMLSPIGVPHGIKTGVLWRVGVNMLRRECPCTYDMR